MPRTIAAALQGRLGSSGYNSRLEMSRRASLAEHPIGHETWNCLAIVGVGLIGGSIGLAAAHRGVAKRVVGTGSRPATLEDRLEAGRHHARSPPTRLPRRRGRPGRRLRAGRPHRRAGAAGIAPLCRPGTLITDAGSTKAQHRRRAASRRPHEPAWGRDVRFVGSHPLAGNEKRGPQHATADLFDGRVAS